MTKFLTRSAFVLSVAAMPAFAEAQSPPGSQPAPSAPKAFASVNLPDWFRIGIEHRGRLEGFTGAGFAANREDRYWLNRFRVTARITAQPWLAVSAQVQDARVAGKDIGPTGPPFRDRFDLRLAYADFANVDKSRVALRAGRQELAFGDQRLIGNTGWLNAARSFDAVRAVLHEKNYRIDGFAASVVNIQDTGFNKSGGGNFLYGAHGQLNSVVKKGTVEPYALVRTARHLKTKAGAPGDLASTTIGTRWAGKIRTRLDYNTEMALQRGSLGSDRISAWAGHWLFGGTMPAGRKSYRIFEEYNYASGDKNPSDRTRGTFDQLYPTAHDKYGLADQVGWRNIHDVRTGVEVRPQAKLLLASSYHSYWLASARDGLYSAGGALLARIAAGAPSRHVGQELDLQALYAASPRIQISGGYAHLFPGAFLKAATPGHAYNFPSVMVTTMLLGMEK